MYLNNCNVYIFGIIFLNKITIKKKRIIIKLFFLNFEYNFI
jgi:hypothetical protein